MGNFYATLLGLFTLSRLFIRAKTLRLFPIALSGRLVTPSLKQFALAKVA
jgi:hypothetical protein